MGNLVVARAAAEEGIRLARGTADLYGHEMMLINLATANLLAGAGQETESCLAQALDLSLQIDDRIAQTYLLYAFACQAAIGADFGRTARLLGAAERAQLNAGGTLLPVIGSLIEQARSDATARLGQSKMANELEAGRRLALTEAVDLALKREASRPESASPESQILLAKRELEVARLVAEGLSNKQIGQRLLIAERTVDSHVRNILNKLGVTSRVQIAAWVASSP